MNVLALVLAGHLIGDWVVQTDWQAANKTWDPGLGGERVTYTMLPNNAVLTGDGVSIDGKRLTRRQIRRQIRRRVLRQRYLDSWRANQNHVCSYHLAMGVALLPAAIPGWSYWTLMITSWVTHSIIDRRWTVRWLMAHTGSEPFSRTMWGVLAVDQALHLAILCVLVGILT